MSESHVRPSGEDSDRRLTIRFAPSMVDAIAELAEWTGAPREEVIREALSLLHWMAREHRLGTRFLVQRGGSITEMLIGLLDGVPGERQ